MTCREFIEFIWRYRSDLLDLETRRGFEDHLAACPDCVTYLQSYERTVRLGREAFTDHDAELPESVPRDLVRAILASRSPKSG